MGSSSDVCNTRRVKVLSGSPEKGCVVEEQTVRELLIKLIADLRRPKKNRTTPMRRSSLRHPAIAHLPSAEQVLGMSPQDVEKMLILLIASALTQETVHHHG